MKRQFVYLSAHYDKEGLDVAVTNINSNEQMEVCDQNIIIFIITQVTNSLLVLISFRLSRVVYDKVNLGTCRFLPSDYQQAFHSDNEIECNISLICPQIVKYINFHQMTTFVPLHVILKCFIADAVF
jgi:hypothetical protein